MLNRFSIRCSASFALESDAAINPDNSAVMLSEALQRNAEHEARLSNISVFSVAIGTEMIRDSSLRSE